MRALVGVLVMIGLCLTACSKAPEPDTHAQPVKSAQAASTTAPEGEGPPRKIIYPVRTAVSAQSSASPAH